MKTPSTLIQLFCLLLISSFLIASCTVPAVPSTVPTAESDPVPEAGTPAENTPTEEAAPEGNSENSPEDAEWFMAAPRLCDPDGPQYTSLGELWNGEFSETDFASFAQIDYVNDFGQSFRFFIYGNQGGEGQEAISRFIGEGMVCLETIFHPAGDADVMYMASELEDLMLEIPTNDPSPEDFVEEEILFGDWRTLLLESPNGLVIGFGLTFPYLLGQEGFDEMLTRYNAGLAEEIDPEQVDELRRYTASLLPDFSDEIFERDPIDFLTWFIEEGVLDAILEGDATVHFSFDPWIPATNDGGFHHYRAWCNKKSARLIATSTFNEPQVSFWRIQGAGYFGIPVAQGTTFSRTLTASPDESASFDVMVKGGPDASTYTISGGWVQGAGCR